jgi:P27 family predicted phage terminase small subunit
MSRRPSKSDEEKKEAGTYRPSRSNPLPPVDNTAPDAPNDLSADEAYIWNDLTERMAVSKLLCRQDFYNLKIYVQTYARYEKNKREVDEKGSSIDGIRFTPAYREMMHALNTLSKLGSKFGLTPVDRLGLGNNADEDDGPDLSRPN